MIIRLCTDTQFSCEQRILWYNQHCIVCSMQCILTTTHWQDYSMTAIRSWRWWKEKKSVPSGHLHTCQIFSMRWCWLIVIDCPEGLGGTWSDGHGNGNGGNAALELEDGLRLQWVGDDDFLGIFSMSWCCWFEIGTFEIAIRNDEGTSAAEYKHPPVDPFLFWRGRIFLFWLGGIFLQMLAFSLKWLWMNSRNWVKFSLSKSHTLRGGLPNYHWLTVIDHGRPPTQTLALITLYSIKTGPGHKMAKGNVGKPAGNLIRAQINLLQRPCHW